MFIRLGGGGAGASASLAGSRGGRRSRFPTWSRQGAGPIRRHGNDDDVAATCNRIDVPHGSRVTSASPASLLRSHSVGCPPRARLSAAAVRLTVSGSSIV